MNVDLSNKNLTENSDELLTILMKNPEITELDISNNNLSKLPIEITFLTCLSVLDIRNNNFVNVSIIHLCICICIVRRNC
jgi:Leucine-rich repeat (LRR) protein